MPRQTVILLAVVATTLTLAACGSDDAATPSPTPATSTSATPAVTRTAAPTPVATPVATLSPATTPAANRTGIPAVDNAIDAVLSGDAAALKALVQYTPTACVVDPQGLGAPPTCRAGEPAGTLVDVLPSAQCEGFFTRPGDVDLTAFTAASQQLYAVYRDGTGFLGGPYVVVFSYPASAQTGERYAQALFVSDEGITGVHYGCSQTPQQFVEFNRLTDTIIPPQTTAAGRTGIPSVDAAIAAVLSGDATALDSMVDYRPVPCVVDPQGLGAPPTCRAGESAGTPVDVLSVAQCEGGYTRPENVDLSTFLTGDEQLSAVYRGSDDFLGGPYVVVFSYPAPSPQTGRWARALFVSDEGITGVHYGCAQTPDGFANFYHLTDTIIPPR